MAPMQPVQNGVHPISAIMVNKHASQGHGHVPRDGPTKATTALRLKVVIRGLPPNLTESAFDAELPPEWKIGKGRVDWFTYRQGKISKDASKPTRTSRAYLHFADPSQVAAFSAAFKGLEMSEASSHGHPTVEFAPYVRIPSTRRRKDGRQGLIDQDPDFQAFLEALTNPIERSAGLENESSSRRGEKITTTPLIEHLREKKAAKDKPVIRAPTTKHGKAEVRNKAEKKAKTEKEQVPSPEKLKKTGKADKAVKESPAKPPNRDPASAPSTAENTRPAVVSPASTKRREPRVMNVAAKIQKDLGLMPTSSTRRKARTDKASETPPPSKSQSPQGLGVEIASKMSSPAPTSSSASPTPKKGGRQPRERKTPRTLLSETTNVERAEGNAKPQSTTPKILKKPSSAPAETPTSDPKAVPPTRPTPLPEPPNPPPSASSTTDPIPRQAFLKHANASQGITEPLIEAALSLFGKIDKVEIDKRKGFAYVNFADAEGLRKAIAASPVKVAQGAVQILEKRDRVAGRLAPSQIGGGASVVTPPSTPAPAPTAKGGSSNRSGRSRAGRPPRANAGASGEASTAVPSTSTAETQAPSGG